MVENSDAALLEDVFDTPIAPCAGLEDWFLLPISAFLQAVDGPVPRMGGYSLVLECIQLIDCNHFAQGKQQSDSRAVD